MNRGLILLSLLLCGALLWAYLLAHLPDQPAPDAAVQVWEFEPREVTRLTFKESGNLVVLEPDWGKEGAETYLWVRSEQKLASLKTTKEKAERPEPPRVKKNGFKGNNAARRVLEDFAGLGAVRMVGKVEALDAEEFGLNKPVATLTLEFRAGQAPAELLLGASNFTNNSRYVQVPAQGKVYLLRSRSFQRLRRADNVLIDRRLFSFPFQRASKVVVTRGGATREIWRLKGSPGSPDLGWSENPDDPEGVPEFETFVAKLGKLSVLSYLDEEDAVQAQEALPLLEVETFPEEEREAPVQLSIVEGKGRAIFGRSSHTRKWVRLSDRRARAVLDSSGPLLKAQ